MADSRKLEAKDKFLVAVLAIGVVITPLLAGLFAGGVFGAPDGDTGVILVLVAAIIVQVGVWLTISLKGWKVIYNVYAMWEAVGFCFGGGLAGGLIMEQLVRIGVEKIAAGEIGYGVFALLLSLFIALVSAFGLFWMHLKNKEFFEKLTED